MSEYQYYEFLAVDQPLTPAEQEKVRELSTRAQIDDTSFVNEYDWGDFDGSPDELVDKYYDLHLYFANWGTRRLLIKVPTEVLEGVPLGEYLIGENLGSRECGEHTILDIGLDGLGPDDDGLGHLDWALEDFGDLRDEILDGDLRPLYVAFLGAIGVWADDEDAFDYDDQDTLEPPVPAGLNTLTAAQMRLTEFLRLDPDLLEEAAQGSKSLADDAALGLADWVESLPGSVKDDMLTELLTDPDCDVRSELMARYQAGAASGAVEGSRTIGELLDAAAQRARSN